MRTGFFVDLSNLYYCCSKTYNRRPDYEKIRDFIISRWVPEGNSLYAEVFGFQAGNESSAFIASMRKLGYVTNYKRPRTVHGNIKKADSDLDVAMQIVRKINDLDLIILASGDGDFVPVIQWIKEQNVKTIVLGCNVSQSLKRITECHEITEDLLCD